MPAPGASRENLLLVLIAAAHRRPANVSRRFVGRVERDWEQKLSGNAEGPGWVLKFLCTPRALNALRRRSD